MPILVACSCGKKLRVRDELQGKKVKCPSCGGVLTAAQEAEPVEEIEEAAPKGPPPLPPARSSGSQKKAAPAKRSFSHWRCQFGVSTRVFVPTDDAIWYAKIHKDDLEQVESDLDAGEHPEEVFSEYGASIPYRRVVGIRSNLKTKFLTVKYKEGDDKQDLAFYFEGGRRERTEALKCLREILEPEWDYQRRELTRLQATFKPLIAIVVIAAVFGFLAFLAAAFAEPGDDRGRGRDRLARLILAYTVGWAGPFGTAMIGAFFVVCVLVWLVMRIIDPPIEVTITPPKE